MSDLGERIRQLMLELSVKWGRRVSGKEFGELVAQKEGRKQPYTAQAVSNWIAGNEPTLRTILAMSQVAGWPKDPAWTPWRLAWGLEMAPFFGSSPEIEELPESSYKTVNSARDKSRKTRSAGGSRRRS